MLTDSYEAQTERVTARVLATAEDTVSFSKTTRAAILAGAGEVGQACKVACTYGLDTDLEVAARFLKTLTLQSRHSHVAPQTSNLKPAKNLIPSKAVFEAFSGMPKKSAPHKDGWTWELLRDAASRPSTAALLRIYGLTWPRR